MTWPAEPPAARGRVNERGFTLIEVLVVIAILGMAIGIFAARGPLRSPALEARGAAEQVARALRLARSQAIGGNRDVAFVLDTARHGYQVGQGAFQALPPTVQFGLLAATDRADTAATGRIVFTPDGGATGGRIRLAAGSVARVVAVNWLSGRVTVADGG